MRMWKRREEDMFCDVGITRGGHQRERQTKENCHPAQMLFSRVFWRKMETKFPNHWSECLGSLLTQKAYRQYGESPTLCRYFRSQCPQTASYYFAVWFRRTSIPLYLKKYPHRLDYKNIYLWISPSMGSLRTNFVSLIFCQLTKRCAKRQIGMKSMTLYILFIVEHSTNCLTFKLFKYPRQSGYWVDQGAAKRHDANSVKCE